MNDHAEIHKLLSAYCNGDLSIADQARVEEHLASCPTCHTDLADLETTLRLIRSTPEVEPPPWLSSRIMARLREETVPRRKWYEWKLFPQRTRLPMEVMAILFVCVSGYYLARNIENQVNVSTVQPEIPATTASSPRSALTEKQEQPVITQMPSAVPPAIPKGAGQKAPQPSPAVSDKTTALPAFAPAPSLNRAEHATPAGGAGIESMKAEPKEEQYDRALEAVPETKKSANKAKKAASPSELSLKYDKATAASMAQPEQAVSHMKVRLAIVDVSSANAVVRQAVLRSGGIVLDSDKPSRENQIKVRMRQDKLPELLERLARIGRIVERPSVSDSAGMLELEINW